MAQRIYAIINTTNNMFYIGRTSSTLKNRLSIHHRHRNCKDRKHRPLAKAMQGLPITAFKIIELAIVDDANARNIETQTIIAFRKSSSKDIYNVGNGDGFKGVKNPKARINNIPPLLIAAAKALHATGEFTIKRVSAVTDIDYNMLRKILGR